MLRREYLILRTIEAIYREELKRVNCYAQHLFVNKKKFIHSTWNSMEVDLVIISTLKVPKLYEAEEKYKDLHLKKHVKCEEGEDVW